MKRKSIFTILAAVFMVLAFSAMAFAAQTVIMKTTTPNIPKSTCYQAGSDTLEISADTIMQEGDIIQFTVSNKTTICKPINMFLVISSAAAGVTQLLDTMADPTAPVTSSDVTAGDVITSSIALGAAEQWGFLVQAAAGQQVIRMTLRVRGAGNLLRAPVALSTMKFDTAGSGSIDPTLDKLFVKLFDGKGVGAGFSGFYTQAAVPVADVYGTALTNGAAGTGVTTNILCIDTLTQDYPFADVENTYDSIPLVNAAYKLTFSGDFRIAHILATQTFNLVTCKGATCGHIVLGTSTQTLTSCRSFDYETLGTGLNGYCTDHTADAGYLPKLIIQASSPFDPLVAVPYVVTAQILVNGVAGEHGVYWSATAPTYKVSNATTCGTAVGGVVFAGGQAYLRADGITAVAPGILVAAGVNNCAAIPAASKAVSFSTTAGVLFPALNETFFELNLPDFVYNLAEVNAGDVVSVRVTLSKGTCGTQSFDLCIGTFGCPAGPAGPGAAFLCPYVPSLVAGDVFWSGIAIANTGATAGTVVLTAYKSDGTTATFTTPSIPGGGMYVSPVASGVAPYIVWTGDTPSEVPAFIRGTSSTIPVGSAEAYIMIGQQVVNGDSMGYLCK